ncbi:MAG: cation:proton antiporter, partial [Candidatus Nitrosotenuis sp.]
MEDQFVNVVIAVCVLLFAAKLMAELFVRLKLPIVLGELIAGMIVGPFAVGALFTINGDSVVRLGSEIKILGEIGAIVILFMAGL